MTKQIPKKVDSEETVFLKNKLERLIVDVIDMDDKQGYLCAKKLGVAPLPKVTRFSQVIHQLQLDVELTRYTEITFKPTSAKYKNVKQVACIP